MPEERTCHSVSCTVHVDHDASFRCAIDRCQENIRHHGFSRQIKKSFVALFKPVSFPVDLVYIKYGIMAAQFFIHAH